MRRATGKNLINGVCRVISIHALLAESDRFGSPGAYPFDNFYPRSPCGERPGCQQPCARPTKDFYPRSPCGERQTRRASRQQPAGISIHALLAESDIIVSAVLLMFNLISIHALLAESDVVDTVKLAGSVLFLSTLSLRRATRSRKASTTAVTNFYPRSPCGERHQSRAVSRQKAHFYPRSPCGERQTQKPKPTRQNQFLSTLSLRRATSGHR